MAVGLNNDGQWCQQKYYHLLCLIQGASLQPKRQKREKSSFAPKNNHNMCSVDDFFKVLLVFVEKGESLDTSDDYENLIINSISNPVGPC